MQLTPRNSPNRRKVKLGQLASGDGSSYMKGSDQSWWKKSLKSQPSLSGYAVITVSITGRVDGSCNSPAASRKVKLGQLASDDDTSYMKGSGQSG